MQLNDKFTLIKHFVFPNFNGRLSLEKVYTMSSFYWLLNSCTSTYMEISFIAFVEKSTTSLSSSGSSCLTLLDSPSNYVIVDSPSNYVIMQNLVNVAPSGMVCLPYLQNWDRLKSRANLVGLISHLSAEFTCQPPFRPHS
ncbi:unnamed protein product [Arabidopsis lyrata]|uniref:UEV domain-containing protein n=1 Tax=Arabidopsis lyrata subsp. lyrata TaxID=81972 RepID=D7LC94_ARALL|nr:hypothetical protein ARALYDRAFT_902083 [Arabidopsis lyrata subsp. lyrata]CAH8264287.1 unnamed protein product [Arabidopsis lyrata]